MKANIFIFLVVCNATALGQERNHEKIDRLKSDVTRIDNEIRIKTDTLVLLKEEIKYLENHDFLLKTSQKDGELSLIAFLRMDGKLRKSNSSLSEIITVINKNDSVRLTDYQNGYWIINKGQFFGYISEMYIDEKEDVKMFKNELKRKNEDLRIKIEAEEAKKIKLAQEKQTALDIQKENEYKQAIIAKYGKETGQKLIEGYYWIGMSKEMALISLGEPRNINKTVGSWGVHEQWVYYSVYLYFENGKLTSYQTSK